MRKRSILFCIFWSFVHLTIYAQTTLTGKAVKVIDGDTFDLLIHPKATVRIRLSDIDCPERHQDYYAVAKQALANIVFNNTLKVVYNKKDRNGRIIGTVFVASQNINIKMVEDGYAWHFTKYSKDIRFAKAETRAKSAKKGLWSLTNPIAPWDFRKGNK